MAGSLRRQRTLVIVSSLGTRADAQCKASESMWQSSHSLRKSSSHARPIGAGPLVTAGLTSSSFGFGAGQRSSAQRTRTSFFSGCKVSEPRMSPGRTSMCSRHSAAASLGDISHWPGYASSASSKQPLARPDHIRSCCLGHRARSRSAAHPRTATAPLPRQVLISTGKNSAFLLSLSIGTTGTRQGVSRQSVRTLNRADRRILSLQRGPPVVRPPRCSA